MKKEWRKYSDVKSVKSKKQLISIIFWSLLLAYSFFILLTSIFDLFIDKARFNIYHNETKLGWVYFIHRNDSYIYSATNKVVKILIYLLFFFYSSYLYYRFIINNISPNQTYLFLGITVIGIILTITNLPIIKERISSNDEIIESFIRNKPHFVSLAHELSIKVNAFDRYFQYEFLIKIIGISVTAGSALLIFLISLNISGMDKIIIK